MQHGSFLITWMIWTWRSHHDTWVPYGRSLGIFSQGCSPPPQFPVEDCQLLVDLDLPRVTKKEPRYILDRDNWELVVRMPFLDAARWVSIRDTLRKWFIQGWQNGIMGMDSFLQVTQALSVVLHPVVVKHPYSLCWLHVTEEQTILHSNTQTRPEDRHSDISVVVYMWPCSPLCSTLFFSISYPNKHPKIAFLSHLVAHGSFVRLTPNLQGCTQDSSNFSLHSLYSNIRYRLEVTACQS